MYHVFKVRQMGEGKDMKGNYWLLSFEVATADNTIYLICQGCPS